MKACGLDADSVSATPCVWIIWQVVDVCACKIYHLFAVCIVTGISIQLTLLRDRDNSAVCFCGPGFLVSFTVFPDVWCIGQWVVNTFSDIHSVKFAGFYFSCMVTFCCWYDIIFFCDTHYRFGRACGMRHRIFQCHHKNLAAVYATPVNWYTPYWWGRSQTIDGLFFFNWKEYMETHPTGCPYPMMAGCYAILTCLWKVLAICKHFCENHVFRRTNTEGVWQNFQRGCRRRPELQENVYFATMKMSISIWHSDTHIYILNEGTKYFFLPGDWLVDRPLWPPITLSGGWKTIGNTSAL